MKAFFLMFCMALAPLVQAQTPTQASQSALEAARELTGAIRDLDMSWMVDRMYPPLKRLYADQYSMRDERAGAAAAKRFMGSVKETDAQATARMAANERALRQSYMDMGRKMKQQGVKVESFTVSPAVSEYVLGLPKSVASGVRRDTQGEREVDELQVGGDRSRLVILPTSFIISVPDPRSGGRVRVEQKSFIYAVRDEAVDAGSTTRGTQLNHWYFIDGKVKATELRSFFTNIPLNLRLPMTSSRQLN
ncbi:MAG: hypothetical protein R3Y56_01965 [Akkermansia sp.]